MDLLIRKASIRDNPVLVDLAIAGGRIVAIEPDITAPAARIIDAAGRVALPGLLEPHIHLDKALLDRRMPAQTGTLAEAIRITGELKRHQQRADVLARSRAVLDMAVMHGVTALRAHPDVDPIQGLIGVETALELKAEYADLLDIQIVAFPQEGIIKAPATLDLLNEAMRLGADVIGGCPYVEPSAADAAAHIDRVFDLAARWGAPLDLHADFADDATDPRFATAGLIARRAIETGWHRRVTLGHVTSLAALMPDAAAPVIDRLAEAGIHIVSLPATDLYLGGRGDAASPRRGLTPVRRLRDAGVNVAFSSNNIRNAFTPFGKADPMLIGNLLAHAGQFGTAADQAYVIDMCTINAARAMGLAADYGLRVGARADLIILDTMDAAAMLADLPLRAFVIKDGRVSVTATQACVIHRKRGSASMPAE
ncbi:MULTISPECIES: amidohydrolase family protein [Acidiphilium]|uniref:Cytosine deaminase n=1 Tax=Acidiphilium rubrum TaxID=526 RepID=A0A8G2CKZ8_ACIRU|nr:MULTISPECIES: amidohydrolase family protein [Acidiphilium]SIQ89935.1 cytosine deaminase [Acidiphilium rubrum]